MLDRQDLEHSALILANEGGHFVVRQPKQDSPQTQRAPPNRSRSWFSFRRIIGLARAGWCHWGRLPDTKNVALPETTEGLSVHIGMGVNVEMEPSFGAEQSGQLLDAEQPHW